jgi:deoxyadenosine/deoxycytidine kinase
MHIAVAGNIGSGKTTLTTLLSKHYKYTPHYESVDDNPYLNDFYKDMQRWSFNLQVYFLNSRFAQLIDLKKKGKPMIQDRTIYEDANIFAPNLNAMMESFVTPPDLLIYLRASVPKLVSQIQKRGRDYEEAIRLDYLTRLNERYEAWISTYDKGPLLIIDVDDMDFQSNKEDLGKIIESMDAKLHGLFENK